MKLKKEQKEKKKEEEKKLNVIYTSTLLRKKMYRVQKNESYRIKNLFGIGIDSLY